MPIIPCLSIKIIIPIIKKKGNPIDMRSNVNLNSILLRSLLIKLIILPIFAFLIEN